MQSIVSAIYEIKVHTEGGEGLTFFANGSSSSDSLSFLLSSSSPLLSSFGGLVTVERFGRSLVELFEFLLFELLFVCDPLRLGPS